MNNQEILAGILNYYQKKVTFLVNNKMDLLKKLSKRSDDIKIKKILDQVNKSIL